MNLEKNIGNTKNIKEIVMDRMGLILAVGRSGTTYLSKTLSFSPDAYVIHEPVERLTDDRQAYIENFFGHENSDKYIDYRRKYFRNKVLSSKPKKYIEVNGYLRLHVNRLTTLGLNIQFIHLVRDGKKVVRSMMSRKHTILNKLKMNVREPLFNLCCRIWASENKILRQNINYFVRLEDISSQWSAYRKEVLEYLNVDQPRQTWEKLKNKKINHSGLTFPEYDDWTQEHKDIFSNICDEEMNYYGYS